MVGCDECKEWFHTERGLNIHKAKAHNPNHNIHVPDFIGLGILKRKLTRKEAKQVTEEVMDMGIEDKDLRFRMAVIKVIETVNKTSHNVS